VEDAVIDLKTAITCLSATPAEIIDKEAGALSVGNNADMLLYDPTLNWTLDASTIFSNGKNTPFAGREFIGKVIQTYVRGQRADTYS